HVPVPGSYNSARMTRPVGSTKSSTTSTLPSGSSVALWPKTGMVMSPVATQPGALGGTTATLGPTDGLAGVLGLAVTPGVALGPATEGWPDLITRRATPTAPTRVAATRPLK